jgi:hypothetical protein
MMHERNNRTWLIYAALLILSIIASTCGQDSEYYGTNDVSSEEPDSSVTRELNPNASSDSKSVSRHYDTAEKELALCAATLMAVETREKMLKEQLQECLTLANERGNDKAKMESLGYAQRIQQLEWSLQIEREQMQLKLSHHSRMMNQYFEELQRTNEQLLQQNEQYRKQNIRVRDELFTVRYECHQFNEAQRQKQISFFWAYVTLANLVCQPVKDWLRNPLWDRILHPHVAVPLKQAAAQTLTTAHEYFDLYFPMLRQHLVGIGSFISRQYVEPAILSVQRFVQTNPHVRKIWILVEEVSEKSQEWSRAIVMPILLPIVERFRIWFLWTYQTLADVLFIAGSSLEQWFWGKWDMCQGTGPYAAVYNVSLSLGHSAASLADGNESWILVMATLLLVHLIWQRRLGVI